MQGILKTWLKVAFLTFFLIFVSNGPSHQPFSRIVHAMVSYKEGQHFFRDVNGIRGELLFQQIDPFLTCVHRQCFNLKYMEENIGENFEQ